jgi:hypothetical protein
MGLKKSTFTNHETKYSEFVKVVEKICNLLKTKICNKVDLEAVALRGEALPEYFSKEFKAKPEAFTKENIIEELLDFLGYDKSKRGSESELRVYGIRWPDYKLWVSQEFYILAEAEPLNSNLYADGRGLEQVLTWIQNKATDTNYGIATDGFRWILIEYQIEYGKHREVKVDLSPFFVEKLGFQTLMQEKERFQRFDTFFDFFSRDRIEKTLRTQVVVLETYQEKVSKKFYDEYMRLVFGDKNSRVCLVNSIIGVEDQDSKAKIAQAVVDRLIFIKFIEAKGWMGGDKNFLSNLWKSYKRASTGSFYDSFLKRLFFNVLNNPFDELKEGPFAGIKYLNGGLFRRTIEEEAYPEYSVEDDVIAKLISFLEGYSFEDENLGRLRTDIERRRNVMSPEILGYIFERTANHEKGAYYTPDNVTEFITAGTLKALILNIFNSRLNKHGAPPAKKVENALADGSLSKADLREIYSEIQNLRIVDPGCGSGAFFMPVINFLMQIHKRLTRELELPFSPYKTKKEIIENNIFGVDLNPQAIEIAKLRLWLELVSSVTNLEEVELLPNIEYNIVCGNTLLGFDDYVEIRDLHEFQPLNIDELVTEIAAKYPDHVSRIKELSEKPTIKNILLIRDLLLRLYKTEQDPKSAQKVKKVVEQVHSVLQKTMGGHYLQFLGKLNSKKQIRKASALAELEKYRPFHWILEFNEVFSNGGFDIVLGNPPYVEFGKIDYPLYQFKTDECGNTYAPFFERAINITKKGGYFGYIVPISAVCTDRMATLQEMLIRNSDELRVSNYDDRPDKIFKGLEDCRSSIIFGHKCQDDGRVLSTHYHRWYAEEKEKLFKFMSFIDVTDIVKPGIVPKIGDEIEKGILKKIETDRFLSDVIVKESKNFLVYHNAPRYWIRAMNFMPKFHNEKGQTVSIHNKRLHICEDIGSVEEITAALNSSLFYWFFVCTSNCRDLVEREIRNFPFDIRDMSPEMRQELKDLCRDLMEDYKKHSRLKDTKYVRTGKVVYQEFYPKESKHILDKIDDVLAKHYGLSKQEGEYIKTFDLRFRMGEDPDPKQKQLVA